MQLGFAFFFNSILLGIGLAMDAFSVSLANGLNEPKMKKRKMCAVAGMFALFQALMPLFGYICVHTIVKYFSSFEKVVPVIALVLLCFIGGKMIIDCFKHKGEDEECPSVGFWALVVQAIATSIDALSVGFTIADYNFSQALLAALIIAVVTFVICTVGILIGKKAGTKLSGKAGLLGGAILIFIGIEIFVTSLI